MTKKIALYLIAYILITLVTAALHEFGHYAFLVVSGARGIRYGISVVVFNGGIDEIVKKATFLMGIAANLIIFLICYFLYRRLKHKTFINITAYASSLNLLIIFSSFLTAVVPGTDLNQFFNDNIIIQLTLSVIGAIMLTKILFIIYMKKESNGRIEKIMLSAYIFTIAGIGLFTKNYSIISLCFSSIAYLYLRIGVNIDEYA